MSDIKCSHCKLEFHESVLIKEEPSLYFCCKGCQGVYHLLKEDGLDAFYDKMRNDTIAPPIESENDTSNFDLESFKQRYIKTDENGFSRVDLVIEGIHCAACVWLNEKVINQTEGVLEASINFSNNKAKVVWDEDTVKLSHIIDKIRSVGYNAYPYDYSDATEKSVEAKRDYITRVGVAIFGTMNIMMIGVAKYAGYFSGMDAEVLHMIHVVEFIFSSMVLFYSGWVFFKGAYYGLKNKIVNMDLLVSGGATITYIYSLTILFGAQGQSYFDSVAMIIMFVLVGKYLEVLGKKSAMDSMDKMKNQIPLEATVVKDGVKSVLMLDQINVGDIIEVKNGEKASVDGQSIVELATFDESSLSGESLPVEKRQGDTVLSGTINIGKVMRYKASKNYANSTFNTMMNLLEDSLASKPKIEEMTNRLSKHFSLLIILLAMFSFVAWYFYSGDFEKSLIITISVIVIACPCALALATPIASLVGISWATEKGLLFKEAKFIETFAQATTVVVDKTGTITEGKLKVKKQIVKGGSEDNESLSDENLALLFALADASVHPVSKAIKKYLLETGREIEPKALENIEQVSAQGLEADFGAKKILGGNAKLMEAHNISVDQSESTIYHFAIDGVLLSTFELEDSIKEDVDTLVSYFKANDIELIMATGDNAFVANKVAKEVGIEDVRAEMSPVDKAELITKLQKEEKKVVMIGDGINDTLALSRSDIAIAMGSGADVALAMSDVVVLNNSLEGIKDSFLISRRTYKFIKQNLMISLVYNLLTIPIAIAGYVMPLVAALSMSLSSLLVVANSMRIKNINKK
ncbi:MAG: Lead, cadmium, zinc and mercury transporting ATPase (EC (EC; Copper-translocating P-type ATPase (EC [uncultured Sulfurovum sp.]|uniref:Lead, cadmium, zinc and mercury transporting ATPase )) n=1 Tax=uncultured Sulfurovum sp. TaxID=269237 RepID=A0A6S6T7E5_9BACT|nr:MAG: Lead, cadmium, zinc and mercury transporting ATPase (EC (EC; Copper-translocating P-type ATPase (EC [uncultured Sulfurovum sp.]